MCVCMQIVCVSYSNQPLQEWKKNIILLIFAYIYEDEVKN